MKREDFLAKLEENVLLFDGAMGTMLYASGVYINRCFDELNISEPSKVAEIHRKYISAGADIIETNTYSANRMKLRPFGLDDKVKEINLSAVKIAKEEAKGKALVAGSIGSATPPLKTASQKAPEKLREIYLEQSSLLEEGGVDLFIVETISDMDEMVIAISAIKEISDKPVIAQATFTDTHRTVYEDTPKDVVRIVEATGVDVVGFNCSIGPRDSLEILKIMAASAKVPISVQPNAGFPEIVDGRYIYLTTPEYMAEYAKKFIQNGAAIVGGCCGTTPEHIKAMRRAIKSLKPQKVEFYITSTSRPKEDEAEKIKTVPTIEKSPFARKLREKFAVSVEISPPRGVDAEKILERIEKLRTKGIDIVNIPDGPRASMRMSPIALAALIESRTKMETMLHYTCRDRNILGMQADLLGAHVLGLRNLLIITGDAPKLGDYPDATAVYDVDSIGLIKIIDKFNQGRDIVGNPVGKPTSFHIGIGTNPGAANLELEVNRLERKIRNGAEFILTQPVYDAKTLESFFSKGKTGNLPILAGILPLSGLRMAEFLNNEVPGMEVPNSVMSRLMKASNKEEERAIGIEVAKETLKEVREINSVRGTYIMLPAGGINSALKIMEVL